MSFSSALKEAREAGVSTDDFMKTWHILAKQDVTDDEWKQNLRNFNKVKSPAMADKSKRLGRINPDQNTPNFRSAFIDDTRIKDTTEGGTSGTTRLQVPVSDTAPRHINKPPPPYEDAQNFPKADEDPIKDSQQTERKYIYSSDYEENTSSKEEDRPKCLPSAENLRQLDADQQTVPKTLHVNLGRKRKETPSGPYEAVDDMLMSNEDQAQLMDTIRHLQDEQDALKLKLKEHDLHLTSLMNRQPSIRHTLQKKVNRLHKNVDPLEVQAGKPVQMEQGNGFDSVDDDHIYAQIEQLYSNFCKIHIPINSLRWMLKFKRSKQLVRSKDDIDAVQDAFARRENSQGYWDIVSVQESLALQKENEELKQKVRMLEEKLEERCNRPNLPKVSLKSADEPMSTISKLAKYSNVRLHHLQNVNDGSASPNTHEGVKKKKPPKPSINPGYTVVAGCPVHTQPAIGSVNPLEMKFEWCISNYSKKLEMERKGQQTRIVSNPFYINHQGYLAQLEVYLNGNSCAQDRCMSVFLRILKGTFDHHLLWPARFCLVVKLINQIGEGHESHTAGGNGFSEFEYRKPMGYTIDSWDCWGFVEFISHNRISQRKYLCNDSIILEISLKML